MISKQCQVCGTDLPESYVNLLCAKHYDELIFRQEEEKVATLERTKKLPDSPVADAALPSAAPVVDKLATPLADIKRPIPRFGITDPNYEENPELDDKNQILANLAQFIYSHNPKKGRAGKLLWYVQRSAYTYVKNHFMQKTMKHPQYPKYLWKGNVVDVGCGSGVGSNILSQEAGFVWGIDKNQWSIEFAREAFTREKNGLYYSSQVTFDAIDIMADTREFMQFDAVVAIEVIEHIYDTDLFLQTLIKKFTKRDKKGAIVAGEDATEFFFTSPNRAHRKLGKKRPDNTAHVREWTKTEFHILMKTYFSDVEILTHKGEPIPDDAEDRDEVIMAKCRIPKVL